jgi:hypothetical protein
MASPYCQKCQTHRDKCVDRSAHKNMVGWMAYVLLSRAHKPLRKRYGPQLEKPQQLAEAQERKWRTDHERGELKIKSDTVTLFSELVQRYKDDHVIPNNRNPKRSTFSRLNLMTDILGKFRIDLITKKQLESARKEIAEDRDWAGATANPFLPHRSRHLREGSRVGTVGEEPG